MANKMEAPKFYKDIKATYSSHKEKSKRTERNIISEQIETENMVRTLHW